MSADPAPASPCIGVCPIDPAAGSCRGCLRTIPEIARWHGSSAVEKSAILVRLDQRRRRDGGT